MKIKIEIEVDTKTDRDEIDEIIAALTALREQISLLNEDKDD